MKFAQNFSILPALAVLVSLVGCGNSEKSTPPVSAAPEGIPSHLSRKEGVAVLKQFSEFLYDDELSDAEIGALGYDLRKMRGLVIAPDENDRSDSVLGEAYKKIFGSATAAPIPFLFDRIKLILSAKQRDANGKGPGPDVVAQNFSVGVWLARMIERRQKGENPGSIPDLRDGERLLHMNSSRIGLVQLGDSYSTLHDSIFRLGVLLHEARHSDCPKGVSAAHLDTLIGEGKHAEMDRVISVIGTCGFLHPNCPSGHPLEGKPACEDGEGWGAYSVMIPFNRMIYRQCSNCSEEDRQAALIMASESATRILRVEDLLDGRLGLPDMNQRGYQN